jgi:hypothetical protein
MNWRFIAKWSLLGGLEAASLALVAVQFGRNWSGIDWQIMTHAGASIAAGLSPYAPADAHGVSEFRWSPIAAMLAVPVGAIGLTAWRLLHFGALGLLRDPRLIFLVAISWPFWDDVELGNLLTFVFVAAFLARRGSPVAGMAYLGLFLLIPRPLMAPMAIWLLWRNPRWRLPFLLAGCIEAAAVAGLGLLGPWSAALIGSTGDTANVTNLGPSALAGTAWLLVGLPLAAALTVRSHLGLAGLAASPYWFPYYLLFVFLEWQPGAALEIRGAAETGRYGTPLPGLVGRRGFTIGSGLRPTPS